MPSRERLFAAGRSTLLPLGGFVTGWFAYRTIEEKGLINENYLRQIRAGNLKLQLYLQQNVFPSNFTEKYGYPEDFLKTMIERLSSSDGASEDERWTFEQVLKECKVPEQVAWLEEHISYDIPYFYIADLFNSWCSLHRNMFILENKQNNNNNDKDVFVDAFKSELLCSGVVEKTLNGVLPYEVAVRTMCVLATGHICNARQLCKLISPDVILTQYEAYLQDLKSKDKLLTGDTVPLNEVTAATLTLLQVMNTVSVPYYTWFLRPLLGNSLTNSYPVAGKLNREIWCRCFGELESNVAGICTEDTRHLADFLSHHFNCHEGKESIIMKK